MGNKIGIQELAASLAKAKGIDGSEAEIFCRSVFEIISEYVVSDKLVKIKGIGTFKLVGVSDRESVNVNTGERIVIAGHTKLSFTPDAVLRDTVNRPFADFETTILSENASTEKMEHIPSEAERKDAANVAGTALETQDTPTGKSEGKDMEQPQAAGKPTQPTQPTVAEAKKPTETKTAAPKPDTHTHSVAAGTGNNGQPVRQTGGEPKKSKTMLYVILSVIIAICLIVFFVRRNQSGQDIHETAKPAVVDKHVADSIADTKAEKAKADSIAKAKADSIAKAKADSDSIAKINQAVMEYYEQHPEKRWILERALQRSRAKARARRRIQ